MARRRRGRSRRYRFWSDESYYRPYVSYEERQRQAAREVANLKKTGQVITPVRSSPRRTIASTFWGRAWCDNLEAYSDFENRLPRGRTYLRNGSVLDLQVGAGTVSALVSGSELYTVTISVKPVAAKHWQHIRQTCAGQVASMIELLQGKFDRRVMEVVVQRPQGLFPAPAELEMDCSCPDWAGMCKHIAAALYGVGVRLDEDPGLLFTLRQVNPMELLDVADGVTALTTGLTGRATIAADLIGEVFGIDVDPVPPAPKPSRPRSPRKRKPKP